MDQNHTRDKTWLTVVKGAAMGAADVVPGVSGGTVAFISGIYPRLLESLGRLRPGLLPILFRQGPGAVLRDIDGVFLLPLFGGILLSIFSLARVLHWALTHWPRPVWALFFGLILASTWVVARTIPRWRWQLRLAFVIGAGLAVLVTSGIPVHTPGAWWFVFLSGAIAVSAMILPGISGSFILVLLGQYQNMITAVAQLQWFTLFSFAGGAVVGLYSIARILNALLARYHDRTVALLIGFMLGSLNALWPWKQVLVSLRDAHGVLRPVVQRNVSPTTFAAQTGNDPQLALVVAAVVVGIALVLLVERVARVRH